ncbi:hypothetical protein BGZ58_003159 [Dissophora ornata]|nr:hypothetical protein BGZ58_003159 [Dissophora ornata]
MSIKATTNNIHYFLAANYIFDLTAKAPEGLSPIAFNLIKDSRAVEQVELPEDQGVLCLALGRELAQTGRVKTQLFDDLVKMEILFLFQVLTTKLARKAMPSDKEHEDIFAHTTFDPFWTYVFPRDSEYTFGWANEVDQGSRVQHNDGYKPGGYVKKMHVRLNIVRGSLDLHLIDESRGHSAIACEDIEGRRTPFPDVADFVIEELEEDEEDVLAGVEEDSMGKDDDDSAKVADEEVVNGADDGAVDVPEEDSGSALNLLVYIISYFARLNLLLKGDHGPERLKCGLYALIPSSTSS